MTVSASIILQILVFGLSLSALYALMAIGLTLIFSIGGIANLAHGAFLLLSGYTVFLLVNRGAPPLIALLVAIGVVAVFSVLLFRVFIDPVMHEPLTAINVALIVAIILEELAGIFVSHQPRTIPPIVSGTTTVAGISIPTNRILAFVLSWLLVIGVWYFVTRTVTGQAILAMSMDKKGAAIIGMNTNRLETTVWAIAGVLAACAGYFIGSFQTISPMMGFEPLILSLVIVVLGGLGSITGSIIAAYIIGMLETAVALMIDPAAQGLLSLVLLILVMLFSPSGLMGSRELHLGGD